MSLFQDLHQSPCHLHNLYSPQSRNPNVASYEQYFEEKIKQNQKVNNRKSKAQRHKQNSASAKQNKLNSKSKPYKTKSPKHNKPEKQKKRVEDYKTDPMYASKISQMLSEISVPKNEQKISKKQLRQLENKIMSEILNLRQHKIFALEGLNKIVDKKNKAIQLLKGFEVLKQTQRLNEEEQQQQNTKSSKLSGEYYQTYQSPMSRQPKESRVSHKSSRPAELINSKISNEAHRISNAHTEANKIRQELMRPLIQNPIILKNTELKAELEQLKQQLQFTQQNKPSINDEVIFYKTQNQRLVQQLEIQRKRLSSIEHKRFETFFPKDKLVIDQMKRLIEVQRDLEQRKQELEEELLNGTIIRKAQDQLVIEELKEENRQLLIDCERIQGRKMQYSGDDIYGSMSLEELEDLLCKQMQNKQIFDELLTQFKYKVQNLERENQTLKRRKIRVSYNY